MLVPVIDRLALHRACRVIWRYLGSEPKAARALNITQPHFHRLRTGHVGHRIQRRLRYELWAVAVAVEGKDRKRLVTLLRQAFPEGEGARLAQEEREAEKRYSSPARKYHLVGELGRASRALEAELERRKYHSFIVAYRKKARTSRSQVQIELGVRRALEALAASRLTGGVEPGLEHLESAGKLKAYLKAAFAAESLLLDPAVSRARLPARPSQAPRSVEWASHEIERLLSERVPRKGRP